MQRMVALAFPAMTSPSASRQLGKDINYQVFAAVIVNAVTVTV